ncbi:TetR/AcrR family transcriptional regulator [Umezawaea beigongshangensis]|uniref:TetR/AcrR family transcriptional regulator n=1 Tax=Umezawaea beigongshangensis TaxID=2780383 RepID=UPI0018F14944|nr:TetR/AcrR family transcriptional regulator [Umezawaea beigongshangensis]
MLDDETVVCVRPRRADAERNRANILAAALDVLIEHGCDAPLDMIARRAGVGNATVYRHFPDRDELLHGVILAVVEENARTAEELLAGEPDPVAALRAFVHRGAESRISAIETALARWVNGGTPGFAEANDRMLAALGTMIAEGQEQGRLRPDIGVGDVFLALCQLTRPMPGVDARLSAPCAHRHLDLFVDGLCAPDPTPLVDAVDLDRMHGSAQPV